MALGAVGVWVTPRIDLLIWAIVALVILDVLLNLHDEAKQLATLTRVAFSALLPFGLRFLGGLGGNPRLFFQISVVIVFGVLLQHVGPQLISLIGLNLPKSEVQVLQDELKYLEAYASHLEAKIATGQTTEPAPTNPTSPTRL